MEAALLTLFIGAISYPVFFETYRFMVFKASPQDDYSYYLLHLLGEGGHLPAAPFSYRILSIAPAIPVYLLVPPVKFSLVEDVDVAKLGATQALAFTSFLSVVLTAAVVYATARFRTGCSVLVSAIGALLVLSMFHFTALTSVDPIALLTIALLFFVVEKPGWYSTLIFPAAFVNEKVVGVFVLLFCIRAALNREIVKAMRAQVLATLASVFAYLVAVSFLDLPGMQYAQEAASFLPGILETLQGYLTGRGLVLNAGPALVMAAIVWLSWRFAPPLQPDVTFHAHRENLLLPFAILLVCLSPIADYGVGRYVMYSLPIVLQGFLVSLPNIEAAIASSSNATAKAGA